MTPLEKTLREKLGPKFQQFLAPQEARKLKTGLKSVMAFGKKDDLTYLAQLFGTDKWGLHWYTPHYDFHFRELRNKKLNLLEIGVGGYDEPSSGGSSLRMWKVYFPKANIYSLDIYDKKPHEEPRIRIFQGSQADPDFLDQMCAEIGDLDLIVDDGSHLNEHVLFTFNHLFPKLKPGGIYVVEDTQTSYWEDYGGQVEDRNNPTSIMGFFKSLVDGLNHSEFKNKDYQPTYYDLNVASIHFYHNLVFVYKGESKIMSNGNGTT